MKIYTAEFVSPGHPDKICDQVADLILDEHLKGDPQSRVAVEVMGGHKLLTINGEVTSRARVNYKKVLRKYFSHNWRVIVNIERQSPQIARGVDSGGAGDQGIMIGYACNETQNLMPLEYELARDLCLRIYKKYPYDGKTQVTIKNGVVETVVASFQNVKTEKLLAVVKKIIKSKEYLINPAGDWNIGGFEADTGLSGRKIVVDNYGPRVPVGGGSFSGKDYTKVDRSGAYVARKIAVDYLKRFRAQEVLVKIAYAIGKPKPVMAVAIVDGVPNVIKDYDLSPAGIRKILKLGSVKFSRTSTGGHFGRGFIWDK